jgi:nitroreductase
MSHRPPALHPLLQHRYSTRAYLDKPVAPETIRELFEAAQWSPSCFNEQPWRFAVASKEANPETYDRIASTLVAGNAWALRAPVLGLAYAYGKFARNGSPNRWSGYDTGQSMAHLTVQAQSLGLNVHQMGGFDAAKALEIFGIPEDHEAMAAFAIGYALESAPPASGARRDFDSLFFGPKPWDK